MRKMIDSGIEWIGEVPEDWKLVQIKSIASCKSEKSAYVGGAYVGLEHIESGSGKLLTNGSQTGIEVDSTVASFNNTDVLFGKLRPYLAKVAKPDFNGQCSTEILVLNPCSRINKDFLFWYLLNPAFIEVVNASTYGAKMPRANWNFIGSSYFPLPPMDVQVAISKVLNQKCTQVDNLIVNVQAQIEKLKAYKQSVITEVVTKGLDPTVPMKDSGVEWIGEIPKHWDLVKIIRIADKSHPYAIGDGDHGMIKPDDYLDQGIPYIRVQNLGWATELDTSNIVYISEETNERIKGSTLRPNDVLFAKTGATIGKTAIIPDTIPIANTTSHVGKITVSKKYNARYVFYVLSSSIGYRQFWEYASSKTTRPELAIDEIKQVFISLPLDIEEQSNIVRYLDKQCATVDRLIAIKQAKIEKLEQYKRSLIYEYVTGKKEVS